MMDANNTSSANNSSLLKQPRLVGQFIRSQRELVGLSQRALGMLFTPPVTTQFISNVERGVTPLPPVHIPTLCTALKIQESEIMTLLEREYAVKLSERLGMNGSNGVMLHRGIEATPLTVESSDFGFVSQVYHAYQLADSNTRKAFETICENMFKVTPKNVKTSSTSVMA